jgi:hypothetical protein
MLRARQGIARRHCLLEPEKDNSIATENADAKAEP